MAGVRFGRSQSAVSVRIKKLEEHIGCQLLVRNNHSVLLTEQGQHFLPKAKRLLEQGERLLAEMRGPTVFGHLRIGILEYVAPHRMPDLLSAMQRKLPEAQLQFKIGLSRDLRVALDTGAIDLALALHDPTSGFSTPVATDPLIWVESEEQDIPQSEEPLDVCLMQAPCIYRQAALEVLLRTNTSHREVVTANSVQSVRSAVISGMGITVLGASCLGNGLRPSLRMHDLGALPPTTISLHGGDHRKEDIVTILRGVLAQHLHSSLESRGSER